MRAARDATRWLAVDSSPCLRIVITSRWLFPDTDSKVDVATTALAYVVMAPGLNIVVGCDGLLDLGYVAFYAPGAHDRVLGAAFVTGRETTARESPLARLTRAPACTSTS